MYNVKTRRFTTVLQSTVNVRLSKPLNAHHLPTLLTDENLEHEI